MHNSNITANQLLGEILSAVGDDGAATFAFSKSLVIAVQMGGLDGEATIQLHMLLARTLLRQKKAEQSLQHLLSAKYILELIGGVRHVALSELYEMLSQVYEYLGEVETTMQCLKQAQECTGDFVRRCQLQFGIAMRMVRFGQFFEGLEVHKETYRLISKVLPETDPRVVEAKQTLEFYMRSAVEVKEKRNAMQQAEYEMALTQALAAAQEQAAAREAARNKNKTITPDDPSHLEALKLSEAAAEELMAEEDWQTSGDKKKKTSKKNKKK